MFIPATQPELVNDTKNKWTQIGAEYFQSHNKDGITLEIRHHENGLWRWWVYDDKSPDPEMAVTMSDDDGATLADALAGVYDYLIGYERV